MRVFRHLVVVLLLGVFVGTPWAAAAEPRSGAGQAQGIAWSTPNPFDSLRNLLVSLWSTLGLGAGNKTGCDIDPWGRCITGPNKTGCMIDPWGRCITDPNKTGCAIDPLGRCITEPNKEGCAIDPWGRCITAPGSTGETVPQVSTVGVP